MTRRPPPPAPAAAELAAVELTVLSSGPAVFDSSPPSKALRVAGTPAAAGPPRNRGGISRDPTAPSLFSAAPADIFHGHRLLLHDSWSLFPATTHLGHNEEVATVTHL